MKALVVVLALGLAGCAVTPPAPADSTDRFCEAFAENSDKYGDYLLGTLEGRSSEQTVTELLGYVDELAETAQSTRKDDVAQYREAIDELASGETLSTEAAESWRTAHDELTEYCDS